MAAVASVYTYLITERPMYDTHGRAAAATKVRVAHTESLGLSARSTTPPRPRRPAPHGDDRDGDDDARDVAARIDRVASPRARRSRGGLDG